MIHFALTHAADKATDAAGYQRLWQIEHVNDKVCIEPHYSILNEFAYRASEPSIGGKLLGMLCSMFLHGSFEHIIGNMLFLWVFGRALEDALGPTIYTGAYLMCGFAATLMYHFMTMAFTPQAAGTPLLGASGAIAGVLGLFAVRFYRTPVRILYVSIVPLVVVNLIAVVAGVITLLVLSAFIGPIGFVVGFIGVWVGAIIYARKMMFGSFRLASMYAIGVWLVVQNIVPGVLSLFTDTRSDSTAHWAHVGGFLLGMVYALLIGSQEEGKAEFMLDDAQKALTAGDTSNAIMYAENILEREPNNGAAYEVIAKSHDLKKEEDASLDNYELAIQKYMQTGFREDAARVYIESLDKHPRFIMEPATQLALGTQLAKSNQMKDAAETLVKIPYTFPDAPEGEISLLRSAQLYLSHLQQPLMAQQLLQLFLERYPDSEWMPQVQRAMRMAAFQLTPPEEEPVVEPEPEPEIVPEGVQRAPRPQAVLSSEIAPPPG